MIRTIDFAELDFKALARRSETGGGAEVESAVDIILEAVRTRGDSAVLEYTEKFDGAALDSLRVTPEEISSALEEIDAGFLDILREAAENIRDFHSRQLRQGYAVTDRPGVLLGQRITPLERVGVYVPGGTASYPSTVLMDVIPAKIAGVDELVMCTPPGRDGKIAPAILAAAQLAGVDIIFKCGGAQAVAAMAYGTESIPRVFKIVGPGNIFVATAKRKVFGLVDIDMVAGPSDVLILADEGANPRYIAADMLAQAEHDRLASAILVTTSRPLAASVSQEIETQLSKLPRREIAAAAIEGGSMIVICESLRQAVDCANQIAPEHLEICTAEPLALLGAVRNAGSIFLGGHSPEALGDYFAGPNHTLPTMGTARFASGLSVDDFVKKSSYTCYSPEALAAVSAKIAEFARREGLEAHARSVEIRAEDSLGASPNCGKGD